MCVRVRVHVCTHTSRTNTAPGVPADASTTDASKALCVVHACECVRVYACVYECVCMSVLDERVYECVLCTCVSVCVWTSVCMSVYGRVCVDECVWTSVYECLF